MIFSGQSGFRRHTSASKDASPSAAFPRRNALMRHGPTLASIIIAAFACAAAAPPGAPGERARAFAPPAPLFISPMGEPFREGAAAAGLERWFAGADKDGDGALVLAELRGDATRFFAALDSDADGELGPVEINRYEREIAPEIQLGRWTGRYGGGMRRRRGGDRDRSDDGGRSQSGMWRSGGGSHSEYGDDTGLQGAGRFGLINIPEPVIDADSDLNRGVGRAEFAASAGQRFLMLDTNHDGRLTLDELRPLLPEQKAPEKRKGRRR
jgi:hypothetical protein